MKLSAFAKKYGVTYRTAWNWMKSGKIQVERIGRQIFIKDKESPAGKKEYVIVYARVSSSEDKENLNTQAKRLQDFCTANGWVVDEIIKEVASGLNDTRPKFMKVLREEKATKIVVEHKDRLTRFGFNYIKELMKKCEIVVVNKVEKDISTADIIEDFVSLVTCFCARIYGKRRGKRKTEELTRDLLDKSGGIKDEKSIKPTSPTTGLTKRKNKPRWT